MYRSGGRWGNRDKGLSLEQLMRVSEVKVFTEEMQVEEHGGSRCVLCGDDFQVNKEIVRELDCGCHFHHQCIDTWFVKNTFCPLCKKSHVPQRGLSRCGSANSVESLGSNYSGNSSLHPSALQFSGRESPGPPMWSPDFDQFFLERSRGTSPAFSDGSDYGSLGEVLRSVELPIVSEVSSRESSSERESERESNIQGVASNGSSAVTSSNDDRVRRNGNGDEEDGEDVEQAPPPPCPLPPLHRQHSDRTTRRAPTVHYNYRTVSHTPSRPMSHNMNNSLANSGNGSDVMTPRPREAPRCASVGIAQRQNDASIGFSPSWATPQHARGPVAAVHSKPPPPPRIKYILFFVNFVTFSISNFKFTPQIWKL